VSADYRAKKLVCSLVNTKEFNSYQLNTSSENIIPIGGRC
jgi:hypothetical protein